MNQNTTDLPNIKSTSELSVMPKGNLTNTNISRNNDSMQEFREAKEQTKDQSNKSVVSKWLVKLGSIMTSEKVTTSDQIVNLDHQQSNIEKDNQKHQSMESDVKPESGEDSEGDLEID